jgi:biotin carboxyl carrier protein
MAKYRVSLAEREYSVEITKSGVWLDGEPVNCDLISLNGNGLHQLSRESQSLEVYLSSGPRGAYEVLIGGRRLMARVDPAYRRSLCSEEVSDIGEVRAPMPGVIVGVPVETGSHVEEGQVIVVEEAMKMQMQLRAPFTGRIEALQVAIGDQVEKGSLLVRIAPDAGGDEETTCPSPPEVSAG